MVKRRQLLEEMRGKDIRELRYELDEARKELFDARFQPDAETSDTSRVMRLRRKIARLLTVLRERAGEAAGGEA